MHWLEGMKTPYSSHQLSQLCQSHDNNLNLIRFLAATCVIFSHSYPLSLGIDIPEPLKKEFGFSAGTLAVDIFFIISGFLITQSAIFRNDWRSFAKSRLLRIYPALLFVIFISTFIIGPLYTSLNITDYISDLRTYSYLLKDSILISGFKSAPPNVFENNPFPLGLNGSLWTLPWEIKMYILLGLLAYLARRHLKIGVILIVVISSMVLSFSVISNNADNISPFFRFSTFFFLGSLAFLFKEKIILNLQLFMLCITTLIGLYFISKPLFSIGYIFSLAYIVLYLAYTTNHIVLNFNKFGDYSYGLYIWAFPVQQIIAYHITNITPLEMFFYTFIATLPIAIASYHYLESKALQLKT